MNLEEYTIAANAHSSVESAECTQWVHPEAQLLSELLYLIDIFH